MNTILTKGVALSAIVAWAVLGQAGTAGSNLGTTAIGSEPEARLSVGLISISDIEAQQLVFTLEVMLQILEEPVIVPDPPNPPDTKKEAEVLSETLIEKFIDFIVSPFLSQSEIDDALDDCIEGLEILASDPDYYDSEVLYSDTVATYEAIKESLLEMSN